MTERVKTHLAALGTDACLIPGGSTSNLQPADVSWNTPFKEAYRELYNKWLSSGEKSFTPAGNVRTPDKMLCLEWVKQAWSQVSSEVVVNSFKACGISVSVDGTEDHLIHCTKHGEVAESVLPVLEQETAKIASVSRGDTQDPLFSCAEDESRDEAVIEVD